MIQFDAIAGEQSLGDAAEFEELMDGGNPAGSGWIY
jgi:hypothetical protein